MDCKSVLKELESLGTAQTRKIYARHGVTGPMFGVSYKHQGLLAKKLKTNHALALQLWNSGNHDARVLATMVADAARLDGATAERWVNDLSNYVLSDGVAKLVGRSRVARAKAEKWIESKKEWIGTAGWIVVSHLAMSAPPADDAFFAELVPRIQRDIHAAANRTRYSMNNALIAIGVRGAKLQKAALAAAKKIGKVEVDHGETGCKTPDAAAYIAKTVEYRRKKAAAK
jgi:3-methyladenine DNA glycosylase AlkD